MPWDSVVSNVCAKNLKDIYMSYMVNKFIEISNPNDGKGMEKFVKCYSDLTGKNSFILICNLSTLM